MFSLNSEKVAELNRLSRNRQSAENFHGFPCPDPRVAEVEAIDTAAQWAAYCDKRAAECGTESARESWTRAARVARRAARQAHS